METNITLSGSGGQGLGLAGMILAEAGILEGKQAIQSQSYGPEARGGASKSDVIIGDDELDYPKVLQPEILLAMSQAAFAKYYPDAAGDAVIIADSSCCYELPREDKRIIAIPITEIVKEKIGNPMCASIAALGVIASVTKIVELDMLEKAVVSRAPRGTGELNRRAAALGYEMGIAAGNGAGTCRMNSRRETDGCKRRTEESGKQQ